MSRIYKVTAQAEAVEGVLYTIKRLGESYDYSRHLSAMEDPRIISLMFTQENTAPGGGTYKDPLYISRFPGEVMEAAQIGFDAFCFHETDVGREMVSGHAFRIKADDWTVWHERLPDVSQTEFSYIQKIRLALLADDMDAFKKWLSAFSESPLTEKEKQAEIWSIYNWLSDESTQSRYLPSMTELYRARFTTDLSEIKAELHWFANRHAEGGMLPEQDNRLQRMETT